MYVEREYGRFRMKQYAAWLVRCGLHAKLSEYWIQVKQGSTTIFRKLCNGNLDEINYTHTNTEMCKIALYAAGPNI